jgi:hypothetical protein
LQFYLEAREQIRNNRTCQISLLQLNGAWENSELDLKENPKVQIKGPIKNQFYKCLVIRIVPAGVP